RLRELRQPIRDRCSERTHARCKDRSRQRSCATTSTRRRGRICRRPPIRWMKRCGRPWCARARDDRMAEPARSARAPRGQDATTMTASRERQDVTFSPLDNRALANLCGPLDANLRQIEAALDVAIAHRGGEFTLTGTSAHAARASEALQRFYAAAEKPLSVDDIQLGLIELATQKD